MLKLIKILPSEKIKHYQVSIGLFICLYCYEIIKKPLSHGRRDKGCSCKRHELSGKNRTKHGDGSKKNRIRLYHTWNTMKQRCNNKKNTKYNWYGKRGIKVCKKWEDNYIDFKIWALNNGYKENLTIDRISNDKGYSPENCRWVTAKENNRNKSTTLLNAEKVKIIRNLYKNTKLTQKQLGILYNVSKYCIHDVIMNRSWI